MLLSSRAGASIHEEVLAGLTAEQKTLPCKLFYDSAGSELFERICRLPEYYLTRTERDILCRRADSILAAAGRTDDIIELGSGSSVKTRLLIEAALRRHVDLRYIPIDISADFLRTSSLSLLADFPTLMITAIAGEYAEALRALPERTGARLFLFLGSNIGNFDPPEAVSFLHDIRRQMRPEDHLLIGFDRVKERGILEAAYNDSEGVTAEFNKNLLRRINVQLGGRFDPDSFTHYAPFVPERSRIEMRLISRRRQSVFIASLDRGFSFQEGEYIHTENSYKHSLSAFAAICQDAGLAVQEEWEDDRRWFSMMLLRPEST